MIIKEYMKKKSSRPWRKNSQFSTLNSQLSSGAGFTLVELIVVISVAAVISVIGIAAFVSFNQSQSLNAAAGDIANMFSLAKSRAASGVKPTPCESQTLNGYQISINIAAKTYELNAICPPITWFILKNTLPDPITFSSEYPPDPTEYFFPVLIGGISASGARTIVLSGFNKTKTITVDSLGNVRLAEN